MMIIKELCKYDRKTPCSLSDRLLECEHCLHNPEYLYRERQREIAREKAEEARKKTHPVPVKIKEPQKPKLDIEKVRPLYEQGLSDEAIAEKLGYSKSTVYNCRLVNGLRPNGGTRSRIDWAEAERLYNQGCNDPEIAKRLNCGQSSVARWRTLNGLKSQKEKRWETL